MGMILRHLNRRDIRKDASVCSYCVGHNPRWWDPPDYSVELDEVLGNNTEPRFDHEQPLTWFPRCG
jgi:hypothetical protein